MVYIDPKKPRRVTTRVRGERTRLLAAQAEADARRNKYRLLVHGALCSLGVWAFNKTDIHSEDPFLSTTLPMLDMLFCVYLLSLLFIAVFNRGHR